MKHCGRQIVSKHRYIKDSDKYIDLNILLKFGSLEKMIITSSDPKTLFGNISKGVDYISSSQDQCKFR